jgi:hypothetical protein
MPLSDRERQILSEIESQLASEDPRFVDALGRRRPPTAATLRYGILGLLVGVAMLLGIVAHIAWGFAGFAVMLVSAVVVLDQLKRLGQDRARDLRGQLRGGLSRYVEGRRRDPQDRG